MRVLLALAFCLSFIGTAFAAAPLAPERDPTAKEVQMRDPYVKLYGKFCLRDKPLVCAQELVIDAETTREIEVPLKVELGADGIPHVTMRAIVPFTITMCNARGLESVRKFYEDHPAKKARFVVAGWACNFANKPIPEKNGI